MPSIFLLSVSNRDIIHLFFFIIFIVVIYLFYAAFRTAGISILKYLETDVKTFVKYSALVVHLLSSLVSALMLPNNFLVSFPFFDNLYCNEIWIPISMIVLLFLHLIIVGWVLSGIFLLMNKLKSIFVQ